MMSYMSAKYGLSKRYTNRFFYHCKFLMTNKSRENVSYVRVSGHKSEASIKSYRHTEQPGFWRQTMLLSQRKQQKTPNLLSQKVFLPKHVSSRKQQFQVIPVSPLSSLENYFEEGNYDFDSSQVRKRRSFLKLSKKLKKI